MDGENDLSADFARTLLIQSNDLQHDIQGITRFDANVAHQQNYNNVDEHPHLTEECKTSSLAVEPGRGKLNYSYPPSFHQLVQEREPSSFPGHTGCAVISERTMDGENDLSADFARTLLIQSNGLQHDIQGITRLDANVAHQRNCNNVDEHPHLTEECKTSSLAVEPGRGKLNYSYPPSVLAAPNSSSHMPPDYYVDSKSSQRLNHYIEPIYNPANVHLQELSMSGTQSLLLSNGTSQQRNVDSTRDRYRDPAGEAGEYLPAPFHPGYEYFHDIYVVQYPNSANFEDRLQSFSIGGWPHRRPSPRQLADAGMFYKGRENQANTDTVFCYKCGQTMHSFEPGDDPTTEHRKYFPECYKKIWVNK